MKDAFNQLIIRAGEVLSNKYVTNQISKADYISRMNGLISLIKN